LKKYPNINVISDFLKKSVISTIEIHSMRIILVNEDIEDGKMKKSCMSTKPSPKIEN